MAKAPVRSRRNVTTANTFSLSWRRLQKLLLPDKEEDEVRRGAALKNLGTNHTYFMKRILTTSSIAILGMLFAIALIMLALLLGITEVHASAVVEQTNLERAIRGIAPLIEDYKLDIIAQRKAEDMARRNYFAHTYLGNGLAQRMSGYRFIEAGENLAMNYHELDVVKAWMSSPSHKRNILYIPFVKTGVGSSNGYIVQLFAY